MNDSCQIKTLNVISFLQLRIFDYIPDTFPHLHRIRFPVIVSRRRIPQIISAPCRRNGSIEELLQTGTRLRYWILLMDFLLLYLLLDGRLDVAVSVIQDADAVLREMLHLQDLVVMIVLGVVEHFAEFVLLNLEDVTDIDATFDIKFEAHLSTGFIYNVAHPLPSSPVQRGIREIRLASFCSGVITAGAAVRSSDNARAFRDCKKENGKTVSS